MSIFGDKWTFTSFGESHGLAIGGVLDGVPAGLHIDFAMIREELSRRAGKESLVHCTSSLCTSTGSSPRALREPDEVEWLSGVITNDQSPITNHQSPITNHLTVSPINGETLDGRGTNHQSPITNDQCDLVTLGTPIAFIIRNKDARPEDYEWLKHTYRVGHADRVYEQKYGIQDWRGGGRASARETAGRVVAGCIAKQELAQKGISIKAALVQVGTETDPEKFGDTIAAYQREGDSIGGIIECRIIGLPVGVGEPIFDKLQAHLAFAVMSINACKGFEYGTGFGGVTQPGSAINHISGGISGGISDGTEVIFRCVFKPTPTTRKALSSIVNRPIVNRSDACVATRAVPVVEAMTALAIINLL